MVTAQEVKALRERTGAGVMDAKRALEESNGNQDKAERILREQGIANASKRMGRDANEGTIAAYVHDGGKVAAVVQLHCETDFVAGTAEFKTLARDLAMQIAAMSPKFTDRDDVPEERDDVSDDQLLMRQKFIKDSGLAVGDTIKDLISKVGENIRIVRFQRFNV